jgi:hypothetical protein
VNPERLNERTRLILRAVGTVSRHQPTLKLIDVTTLEDLRSPGEVALDAVDYIAVRWDGPPETAVRQLRRQGWLAPPAVRTLVYATARSDPNTWQAVERAGFVHRLYCPSRLPETDQALIALRPFLSGSDHPYIRR